MAMIRIVIVSDVDAINCEGYKKQHKVKPSPVQSLAREIENASTPMSGRRTSKASGRGNR